MVQITLKRGGQIVHRENRTFDRRQAAEQWARRREAELAKPDAVLGKASRAAAASLGQVIDRYLAESSRAMGRTKTQCLRSIKTFAIASKPCGEIGRQDFVDFAQELAATGVQPTTVQNYLSHLGAVVEAGRLAWGYPLDKQALSDGRAAAKLLGVTGKGRSRERRPTLAELDTLLTHFEDRQARHPDNIPMARVIAFAIFSTRRLDEITRIVWADLDEAGSRVMVRDMKNPGEKIGNDVWCDLPEPALRIALAMPKAAPQIFPYNSKSISSLFTRACQFLAIEDLHFHDLRHEGVSRLFEMGLNIPHVAAVSGHRTWASLKRYTHLRQTGDKFAGWKWLEVMTCGKVCAAPTQQ
nr:tyrosine-type recombinase/integrase [Rhodoblastus acidophilus]